jgi:hypothetical protein
LAYQRQHLLSTADFAIAVFAFVEARFKKRLARFIVTANVTFVMIASWFSSNASSAAPRALQRVGHLPLTGGDIGPRD